MSTKNKTKKMSTKKVTKQKKCLQDNSVLTWKYYYAHLSENSVYNWSVHQNIYCDK